MADNGGHYDPRAQAMEEIHFDWRCIVCCMVALFPLHLEQQHLPGTESVYFDLDNTPWVKCDSATPHSTYNVVPGSHWPLSGTSASSALFSAAENFRSTCRPMSLDYPLPCPPSSIVLASLETPSENTCSRFTSVSLVLKMARKRLCPDDGTLAKKQKKQPGSSAKKTPTMAKSSDMGHYGDSAHKHKKIGLFTVE